MNHNNKIWQVFFIIVFVEILFLILSFYKDETKIFSKVGLNFYSFSELVDFTVAHTNTKADSLIDKYMGDNKNKMLSRRQILTCGQNKKNIFLENPDDNNNNYALDYFFDALINQSDTCIVRIAHYGDSQLEGDRITSILRKKFQKKFGGSGVGYIPFTDIASPILYSRETTGNWCRFNVFNNKYPSGLYGIAGVVFKFNNCKQTFKKDSDTLSNFNDTTYIRWLTSTKSGIIIKLFSQINYNKISVMYGNSTLPCFVKINDKNKSFNFNDTLPPVKTFCIHNFNLGNYPDYLKIEFESAKSPDFYGLLLDANNGVQIDNYAIRGHSGTGLLNINQDYLAKQLKILNTKLIIFQYGGNLVPYVHDSIGYKQLEKIYYLLFIKFKQAVPDASILVVSTGDMARKKGDKYVSYPQIYQIVEAQRRAALKAGCAFWDLYATMGGEGSINSWTSKRLSSPEGHFSPKGQQIIADELFNTIMIEYNSYKLRKHKLL